MLIRSPLTQRASRGLAARSRASAVLVLGAVLAAALVAPALASATPTVTSSAKILPIPGFPHTGNCLGCGADLETVFTISGTEYAGGPPPLEHVRIAFPKGTKINYKGFPTCSPSAVERGGIGACPKAALAGKGHAEGFVSLGGERVAETTETTPFFTPGGGIGIWIEGNSPTKIEKLAKGSWSFPASGPVINVEVPIIETLPGAPDASAAHIVTIGGGAIKKGKKTTYYGQIAKTCPKGGFTGKAELTFLGEGTVSTSVTLPCPPKKK